MNSPIDLVMLIDDNPDDNYLHSRLFKRMGVAREVTVFESARDALAYLEDALQAEGGAPWPDLVFLDINMPGMDGWDFLEAYESLGTTDNPVMIVMLSSSIIPEDAERANQIDAISRFLNKPLTQAALDEILDQHFQ